MTDFPAIRLEGGLFGPDLLGRLLAGELPGQQPADFGLSGRQGLTDEIAAAFADARAHWEAFRRRLDRLPEGDAATSVTRDAWALPFFSLLGYELRYNPRAYDLDGASFAISHRAGDSDDAPPVHIVGARQLLGRVAPGGRPRLSPHALLQEFLNRTEHLWGVVTNGETLRLLRDSAAIRRQAYVEFNLRQIFEEQRFQDFAALYRLLHRTRLPQAVADARDCLLERYYQRGLEQGDRVRERLRDGVEQAIQRLANGFLAHPANADLRDRLTRGATAGQPLTPQALYQQLLRLVYRFLFLLVSEERGLISSDQLYRDHYSISRLRRCLDRRRGEDDADDLWHSLRALWLTLGDAELAGMLGAAPLNGQLFEPLDLDACAIANRDLLAAFWHLAYYHDAPNSPPRPVNYAALDVEELGSVYESLLDYHPQIIADGVALRFELAAGSERKATGSYYTPPELVGAVIRATLDSVIADRLAAARTAAEKAQALLSIRVLDPACGSGHFLLAAARRLGKALARVRSGEDEPAPEQVRLAIREVVAHCIYGVDKNPLAVELARVALWLESHAEGKPLTFLDHRIQCGDSLVGLADLAALEAGIPDEAYAPVSDDDKRIAAGLKRQNRAEASGQTTLFAAFDAAAAIAELGAEATSVDQIGDDTPSDVRAKKQRYQAFRHKTAQQRIACNLWTAAFFQARRAGAPPAGFITTDAVRAWLTTQTAHPQAVAEAEDLAAQHGFFHWPLAFPDVFAHGGFDVVLGNPPWERIKLQEQEFFAARDPEIARAPTAAVRKRLIAALPAAKPDLWAAYRQALHAAESASRFLRGSGCYPLTGRGDINTYSVFAERMRALLRPGGRMGVIVPTGIATDDTNKHFFADIVARGEVVSLYDFENRKKLFPAVDSRMKFALLTVQKRDERTARHVTPAEFAFFLHEPADLADAERRFTLTPDDFRLLNPNTRTAPIFRSRRDAELTKHIYRRVPVLIDEGKGEAGNPWGVAFATMFHMTNDSGLFQTSPTPGPVAPTPSPSPTRGEESIPLIPSSSPTSGEGSAPTAGPAPTRGEGSIPPSPLVGEGGKGGEGEAGEAGSEGTEGAEERWEVPEELRRKMVEVAREFRKHPTPSEAILWQALRGKQLDGIKFRRQQNIGPFIVDFYAAAHRLVVEVDGGIHESQKERDRQRQQLLESLGLRFVRISAEVVERDLPRALDMIRRACAPTAGPVAPTPSPSPTRGEESIPLIPSSSPTSGEGSAPTPHPSPTRGEGSIPPSPLVGEGGKGGEGEAGGRGGQGSEGEAGGEGGKGGEGALLPLYEAKLVHQFDHRFATYRQGDAEDVPDAQKADPTFRITPRYWVPAAEVEARLRAKGWDRGWLLGWRDITNATNERTVIAAVIPRVGVGNTLSLLFIHSSVHAATLISSFNSFVLDFITRQKLGGTHLSFKYLSQLPVLPPSVFDQPLPFPWQLYASPLTPLPPLPIRERGREGVSVADFIRPRVLELTYTAWDLAPFARDLGYDGPPFRWDAERRFWLRAELDALFFHLYLGSAEAWEREASTELKALFPTPRDAAAYILDQFPIVKRRDEERFGEYRTARAILSIYDAMAEAQRSGQAWRSSHAKSP